MHLGSNRCSSISSDMTTEVVQQRWMEPYLKNMLPDLVQIGVMDGNIVVEDSIGCFKHIELDHIQEWPNNTGWKRGDINHLYINQDIDDTQTSIQNLGPTLKPTLDLPPPQPLT